MKEQKTKKYRLFNACAAVLALGLTISSPAMALNVPKEFNNGLPGNFAVPDCQEIEKTRIHSKYFSLKQQQNRARLSLYQIENIGQDFFIFHENGSHYAGRLFEDGVIELSSIEQGDTIHKDKGWEGQNIIQRHEYMGCFDLPQTSPLASSLEKIDGLYASCKLDSNKTACQAAFFSAFDKNDNQYLEQGEVETLFDVALDIGHFFSPMTRPEKYTKAQKRSKVKTLSQSLYHALNKEMGGKVSIYEWSQYQILPNIGQYESTEIALNLKRLFPILVR